MWPPCSKNEVKSEETISEEDQKELVETFKKHLNNPDITVKAERFKSAKTPAVINVDEFMRRMTEMNGFYGMQEAEPAQNATLVLNLTNPVVSGLLTQAEEKQKIIVNQIYYLAMLAYKKLTPEELSDFVNNSSELLFNYCK